MRMKHTNFRESVSIAALAGLMIIFTVLVKAQNGPETKPQTGSTIGEKPSLTASLVDAEKKAQQKAATVQVTVTGIKLIDPGEVKERPAMGQGHLHYQVDGGPVIATTTTKLSFHGFTAGAHKIVVMLAGNDYNPLGPQQTLAVTVP